MASRDLVHNASVYDPTSPAPSFQICAYAYRRRLSCQRSSNYSCSHVVKRDPSHLPSFSLGFQEGENVVEPDGTLDVSDDRSVGLVHEFNSDLGDTSSGSSSAEDLEISISKRVWMLEGMAWNSWIERDTMSDVDC
jgi:hypothetical protein